MSKSSPKSPITCHVLDSSLGKPAKGVPIQLQKYRKITSSSEGDLFAFDPIAHGETNDDGRCLDLLTSTSESSEGLAVLTSGLYKIVFQTKNYFDTVNRECFYPWVEITFEVKEINQHYHIPLLLSPYSYTTYRGS
ncbi:hypothetical protein EW145_g3887 [Phellinidium pouzarii]|uniref:5-hydroxyisourate hydrolase n=1 Tax=Phellinidium pouzarii TaxID=167371 RepID=A0A4S4L5Z8_9AGAM|nr:hypothetical protein EW145_g3887 [Phellinidium pouzarii]